MKKTIVFIHGMYMTPLCWENWMPFFQARGYDCLALAWPGRETTVEDLRARHPDPALGRLTLRAVLENLGAAIQKLKEKPVLVGHSMGGLVVHLLLQRDLASAGVAIDSAPPQGVFTAQWSFLKSNFPHINPLAPQGQPIAMSFERFQYAFVNGLPLEVQRDAYDRYVVPESRRVPAQSLGKTAYVDFGRPHAPLFLIAGSADHIIPAGLNHSNYQRYQRSSSPVEFREFPGRTHFTIGQPGWEQVAEAVAAWLPAQGG
jgi:alpha-beta hydrolase superfamily lysophospholipase